jgi:site-specific DNA recombinase
MAAASKPRPMAASVRCAIYTRKSTDEGLDSDFNTLDAQRESAEAYVASQRHEGWITLPQKYDDGGFTGANMERPALTRLLDDVRSGLVNCVVVYKVDRLTRSLLDFAKIMEVLDKHGATFVSVTQQFNTTASLGRLTLNILLSFAQFEREMIAERTRDKMSAARRKGKWVGGNPVLGYDVHPNGGALVVNEDEAGRVRAIFGLYLELGSLLPVVEELDRRGWRLKQWTTRDGKVAGGKPFTRARLHQLLTNITYTGQVRHRGEVYPGEQGAIIDAELWEKVQARLKANAPGSGRSLRNKYGALLKGVVRCATCNVGIHHRDDLGRDVIAGGFRRARQRGMRPIILGHGRLVFLGLQRPHRQQQFLFAEMLDRPLVDGIEPDAQIFERGSIELPGGCGPFRPRHP